MKIILRRATSAFCLALCCIPLAKAAPAKDEQPAGVYPFDAMVSRSDYIFRAECTDRKTIFAHGNIYTTYKLKPSTVYKGRVPMNNAGEVELAEIGGAAPGNVPIAQQSEGMAGISKGEEVLLFTGATTRPAAKNAKETLVPKPAMQILGGNQGRYSVLRDPESGEARIVRGARYVFQKDAIRQGADQVTPDQAAKMKKSADAAVAARSAAARTRPGAADEVYQFEPLNDVETRLRAMIAAEAQKTAP